MGRSPRVSTLPRQVQSKMEKYYKHYEILLYMPYDECVLKTG